MIFNKIKSVLPPSTCYALVLPISPALSCVILLLNLSTLTSGCVHSFLPQGLCTGCSLPISNPACRTYLISTPPLDHNLNVALQEGKPSLDPRLVQVLMGHSTVG